MQHIASWNQNLRGSSKGYSTEEHWIRALIIDARLSQDIDTDWLWPHICFSFLCWSDTSLQDLLPKPAPVSPPCNIQCFQLRLTITLGQQHQQLHSLFPHEKQAEFISCNQLSGSKGHNFFSWKRNKPCFFLCAPYLLVTKGAQLCVPLCSGSPMHKSTKHIQATGG